MGLKSRLEELVKERKYVPYANIENWCKVWGYRVSHAERRLREIPEVVAKIKEPDLFNKKKYIIGYKWRENE